jgi:hypothetical protein
MIQTILKNGFWLLVPVLLWNIVLAGKIKHDVLLSDAGIANWLLILENVTRIPVFIYPLFLSMGFSTLWQRVGLGIYLVSVVLYCASWLPFLDSAQSAWTSSYIGVIAPFLMPIFVFIGISLITSSWLYFVFALLMIIVHVIHGTWAYMIHF